MPLKADKLIKYAGPPDDNQQANRSLSDYGTVLKLLISNIRPGIIIVFN
jgi:hypothetical protein